MDTDRHPDAPERNPHANDPDPVAFTERVGNRRRVIDLGVPDRYERSDLVAVTVYDGDGQFVCLGHATVDVTDDPANRLVVRFRDHVLDRWRELLPVRPEFQPDDAPGKVYAPVPIAPRRAYADWVTQPQPDPAAAGTFSVQHAHTHRHTGDGANPHDHGYAHDHLHRHVGADAFHTADAGHGDGPHGDHSHLRDAG